MMSLQTSTHSSQMKTVGPAISLRTSFWSLLQNEQRRTSLSPLFFMVAGGCCATPPRPPARYAGVNPAPLAAPRSSFSPAYDLVDDTIRLRLLGVHDEVPVGVAHELVQGLLGVEGQDLVDAVLDPQDLLGLDRDVRGLALGAPPGLVDQDPGVGEGEALAGGPRRQQHGSEGSRLSHADGLHVGPHELHGVVDGHARRGHASGAVDVDVDVLLRVLGFEEEELGDDQVRHHVVDGGAYEDDVVLQQARVDVVGPLAARGLLDHHGDEGPRIGRGHAKSSLALALSKSRVFSSRIRARSASSSPSFSIWRRSASSDLLARCAKRFTSASTSASWTSIPSRRAIWASRRFRTLSRRSSSRSKSPRSFANSSSAAGTTLSLRPFRATE